MYISLMIYLDFYKLKEKLFFYLLWYEFWNVFSYIIYLDFYELKEKLFFYLLWYEFWNVFSYIMWLTVYILHKKSYPHHFVPMFQAQCVLIYSWISLEIT